jgi:hypothetical protein
MARLGLAYLGPAWLGSRPQAGPGTALESPAVEYPDCGTAEGDAGLRRLVFPG